LSVAICNWYTIGLFSASVEAPHSKVTTLLIHNKLFVGATKLGTEGAVFAGSGVGVAPSEPPPPQEINKKAILTKYILVFMFILLL
jgi:hypothetical protein